MAWRNAEMLWNDPAIAVTVLEHAIDSLTTFASEALLVPVP